MLTIIFKAILYCWIFACGVVLGILIRLIWLYKHGKYENKDIYYDL